jgi:NAD(P)-dependent dehydrogenase (short-subunit alcohol dehydrogenase family)
MRQFKDKVAVVAGGASGIGLAMARRFAREGMRVVIADVDADALAAAEREIRSMGATALGVRTDVARSQDIEALAAHTVKVLGAVHIVCNNAGVGGTPGVIWEHSLEEWQWVMGANLWGVIHGIRTFVPIMLKQGEDAQVVNTASVAGLLSSPFMGTYNATKHAVVTISEVLYARTRHCGRTHRCVGSVPGIRENANHGIRPKPASSAGGG